MIKTSGIYHTKHRQHYWRYPDIQKWRRMDERCDHIAKVFLGLAKIDLMDEFFRELAQKGAAIIRDPRMPMERRYTLANAFFKRVPWMAPFDLGEATTYRKGVLDWVRKLDRLAEANLLSRSDDEADRERATQIFDELQGFYSTLHKETAKGATK